jgi:polar amino acid transport system substrate-binding protein
MRNIAIAPHAFPTFFGYNLMYRNETSTDGQNVAPIFQLLLFIIMLTPFASAATDDLPPHLQRYLQNHPHIILGTGDAWAPYSLYDANGSVIGFDQDILEQINRLTGAHFVLRPGNWSVMQDLARRGTIEGLSALTRTPERDRWLLFTRPYAQIAKMLVTAPNRPIRPITSPESLEGRTVVVLRGNAAEEKLARQYGMRIVYADSTKEKFNLVLSGRYPLTMGNPSIQYELGLLGLSRLKIVYTFPQPLDLRFAIRKTEPEAMEILQMGLEKIPYETLQKLEKKWFFRNFYYTGVPLDDRARTYLKNHPVLRVCARPYAPFAIRDEEGWQGVSMAILKRASEPLGLTIETADSSCDLHLIAPKGASVVSRPYFSQSLALVTRAEQPYIEDLAAIKKRIAVIGWLPYAAELKKRYPQIEWIETDSPARALKLLLQNKVYGWVDLLGAARAHIEEAYADRLKIAAKLPIKGSLRFGVRDTEMAAILNLSLQHLDPGDIRTLYRQWMPTMRASTPASYPHLHKILALLGIIVLVSLFWLGRLSRAKRALEASQKALENLNATLEKRIDEEVRRSKEKDLLILQQSRLAQMGEMISMIAHQWRQPLNVISLKISYLKIRAKRNDLPPDKVLELSEETLRIVQHLSRTIDDFRYFFKPTVDAKTTDFRTIAQNALTIVGHAIESRQIEIATDLRGERTFKGYPSEMAQVVINLLKNAQDAILEQAVQPGRIVLRTYDTPDGTVLEVHDNAGGIPAPLLDKIFDPYFSTKDEKNGTGLGLYMSKQIVEKHEGGRLFVENRDGGALFRIEITIRKEQA